MSLRDLHIPLSVQGAQAAAIAELRFVPTIEDGAIISATPIIAAGTATAGGEPTVAMEIIPCSPACRLTGNLIPAGCTLPPYDGDLPPNAPI